MNNTIIQVPVSKDLRDRAEGAADLCGFSSVQEAIRIFLNQLAERKIEVKFVSKPDKLSPRNDARYAKMLKEVKSSKVKPFTTRNVDDLMTHLHNEKD